MASTATADLAAAFTRLSTTLSMQSLVPTGAATATLAPVLAFSASLIESWGSAGTTTGLDGAADFLAVELDEVFLNATPPLLDELLELLEELLELLEELLELLEELLELDELDLLIVLEAIHLVQILLSYLQVVHACGPFLNLLIMVAFAGPLLVVFLMTLF